MFNLNSTPLYKMERSVVKFRPVITLAIFSMIFFSVQFEESCFKGKIKG